MIKLDQQKKQLELKNITIANELVFEYFDKKVARDDYQEVFGFESPGAAFKLLDKPRIVL